jgi:isocitrate lyase
MESTQTEVKAMEQLREKIKKIYSDEMLVFNFGQRYIGWETNKVCMFLARKPGEGGGGGVLAIILTTLERSEPQKNTHQ